MALQLSGCFQRFYCSPWEKHRNYLFSSTISSVAQEYLLTPLKDDSMSWTGRIFLFKGRISF